MTKYLSDFFVGDKVRVEAHPTNDSFESFSGTVSGFRHDEYVEVRDDVTFDVWDCDPNQLTFLSEKTIDTFGVGELVNVEANDYVPNAFTGRVIGHKDGKYVQVKDQDGDVFDCDPTQLTFSSDAEMHD